MSDVENLVEHIRSFHCWNSTSGGCSLTSEQGRKLTDIAMKIAEKRGHDNGGTGGLAIHPTQEIPLVSLEMYFPHDGWYTVLLEIDWTKNTACFYSEHEGGLYSSGCPTCLKLLEEYKSTEK